MSKSHLIHEHVVSGRRLGRHYNFDVRSLGFRHEASGREVVSVQHDRKIGILDQGDLGSCTGNSGTGNLGTEPIFDTLPAATQGALNEDYAIALYSDATAIDPYPGTYPPDDTGSDGASVAQVLKNRGLISGYKTVLTVADMQDAVQDGPLMIGINWYSSFDTPASDGTISLSKNAYVRGGHEPMIDGIDMAASKFLAVNSWGESWGVQGRFKIPFSVMTTLLSQDGDCTVLVPGDQPAPVAKPVLYVTQPGDSMLSISVAHNSPVSTMFRTTLQQFKAFTSGISKYMQAGDMTAPLPVGETLCLAWPQYHFA